MVFIRRIFSGVHFKIIMRFLSEPPGLPLFASGPSGLLSRTARSGGGEEEAILLPIIESLASSSGHSDLYRHPQLAASSGPQSGV